MPETEADLSTMTREDAKQAFDEADAVILPLGSTEQHSIHLPVSTDTLRSKYLSVELVKAAIDHDLQFVRLPTVPYGYSEHHMNYTGTITLHQETYKRLLIEIAESLSKHGVDRLVMLNCHGGNQELIELAADRIKRDLEMMVHPIQWVNFAIGLLKEEFGDDWGHAGDHETSVIDYIVTTW